MGRNFHYNFHRRLRSCSIVILTFKLDGKCVHKRIHSVHLQVFASYRNEPDQSVLQLFQYYNVHTCKFGSYFVYWAIGETYGRMRNNEWMHKEISKVGRGLEALRVKVVTDDKVMNLLRWKDEQGGWSNWEQTASPEKKMTSLSSEEVDRGLSKKSTAREGRPCWRE